MTAGQIAFAAGVATTVLGTLLGFGLTVLWDRLKVKGEAKRRAEAMVGAMAEETIFNLGILARNATGARQEIAWLDEEKELVPPFVLLRVAALDLAATQLSVSLVSEPKDVIALRQVRDRTDAYNELVRSREAYRHTNHAMDNFHRRMRIYDELVLAAQQDVLKELASLPPALVGGAAERIQSELRK